MAVDLARAMQLAVDLERIVKAGIPSRYEDRDGFEAGFASLNHAIAKIDPKGRLRDEMHCYSLRACGIRASSTISIHSAVRNWIRQVEEKSGLPLGCDPATNIGE